MKTFTSIAICKECHTGFDAEELHAEGWNMFAPMPCCGGELAIMTTNDVIVENMCEEDQEEE
jgi:hypothetical protein